MAEAWLNHLGKGRFLADSAGIEGGSLNPLVAEAMQECGISLEGFRSKTVDEVIASGMEFDAIVTVCDEANGERCPYVPGFGKRMHWSFPDPSVFQGSHEEKLEQMRGVRDAIRERIAEFVASSSSLS